MLLPGTEMTHVTEQNPAANALFDGLRRVRWSVLATLGVCAGVIVFQTTGAGDAKPHETQDFFTGAAFALGLAAILSRAPATRPKRAPRQRVNALLLSLLLAGCLGLLGVAAASVTGARETPLLYTLAGALFSLRPFPELLPRER